jgi:hypothetical protein
VSRTDVETLRAHTPGVLLRDPQRSRLHEYASRVPMALTTTTEKVG